MGDCLRVLHVEVGGSYGGSLRALETYLAFGDRSRYSHYLLVYYPTPGLERLVPLTRSITVALPRAPEWIHLWRRATHGRFLRLRNFPVGSSLATLRRCIGLLVAVRTATALRRSVDFRSVDLIHVNNTFPYQVPTFLAARTVKSPIVAHVRNAVRNSGLARALARRASCIVTVCRAYENEIRKWNTTTTTATCHDGVPVPEVNEPVAQTLRSSLLSGGTVLIGSVGRLDHQKGYEYLVRAAQSVVAQHPHVRFAVAGDGPLRANLAELAASLGVTNSFRFCGFMREIGNFLAALDVFVSSSLWEGLPIALIEAMLVGKPVVATGVGGVPEVVIPDETGELVPPGDAAALARALSSRLRSGAVPLRQIEQARRLALALCEPRQQASAFDRLLEATVQSVKPTYGG